MDQSASTEVSASGDLVEEEAKLQNDLSSDRDEKSGDSDRPVYIARGALAVVMLPEGTEPAFTGPEARELSAKVDAALRKSLEDDTRVSFIYPSESAFAIDNARTRTISEVDEKEKDLLKAVSERSVMRLNEPIVFRIRVPAKNQPRYRSMDDVPADEYLVIWNGIALLIQWDQSSARATGSGGHVVFDVLEDVGTAAGYPVKILACSPGCVHKFLHADVVTFSSTKPPKSYTASGHTPVGSTVVSPFSRLPDDRANAWRTYGAIGILLDVFVEVSSLADSITLLEARARSDSAEMMTVAYRRITRRRFPRFGAFVDVWHLRGSRNRERELLAGLWLAIAEMESRERSWRRHVTEFEGVMTEHDLGAFSDALETGKSEVESLDVTLVRSVLERTAQGLDTRMIFLATLSGAGAALAGAGITSMVTAA